VSRPQAGRAAPPHPGRRIRPRSPASHFRASEPVPLDLFTAHAELRPEPLSSPAADPPAFAGVLTVVTGYALASWSRPGARAPPILAA
jgi:hypothetical protein